MLAISKPGRLSFFLERRRADAKLKAGVLACSYMM
jgi:hypothetical protein